jgi:hypothetical protein
LKDRPEPLDSCRAQSAASHPLEFSPPIDCLPNRPIPNAIINFVDAPKIIGFNSAWAANVPQASISDRQALRPPSNTMKELVTDFRFEARTVGFRLFSAITARRTLEDVAGLATNADRAPDVVVPAAPADGKHVIASMSCENCCSVTSRMRRPPLTIPMPNRANVRRTLRSRSRPL